MSDVNNDDLQRLMYLCGVRSDAYAAKRLVVDLMQSMRGVTGDENILHGLIDAQAEILRTIAVLNGQIGALTHIIRQADASG